MTEDKSRGSRQGRPRLDQPRDYLAEPMLFGSGPVKLRPERLRSARWSDVDARAAVVQSDIATSANLWMARAQLSRKLVAERMRIHPRHVYRLLNGESWMQVHDVVAMSAAIGRNLMEYRVTSTADLAGRFKAVYTGSTD